MVSPGSHRKRIGTSEVPQRPTRLVFGGKDRHTLFITARLSLYGAKLKARE
jgi:sugar lactone lactonase YvrE